MIVEIVTLDDKRLKSARETVKNHLKRFHATNGDCKQISKEAMRSMLLDWIFSDYVSSVRMVLRAASAESESKQDCSGLEVVEHYFYLKKAIEEL